MNQDVFRVLVTGANGFIAKNLMVRLGELGYSVATFVRSDNPDELPNLIANADVVIHLAGENRPQDESAFARVNTGLTVLLCDAIEREVKLTGRKVPLVLASSIQADRDNLYGRSKLEAEKVVRSLSESTGNPCVVFRLPGVFGKWCRPNYNSVVATFCHNLARDLSVTIYDPEHLLRLVYVDDVVSAMISTFTPPDGYSIMHVSPEYNIKLGDLFLQIQSFANSRVTLFCDRVGAGLVRALYATYVSYLPKESFSYEVPKYTDSRGMFVEVLKTPDCGQFSYFTAHSGVTRGGHYHHSKTEKFLVIKGWALFRFRHLLTNELVEFCASGDKPQVVDTIPGWSHDITNIGDDEMVVMLWANENFDRERPDTVSCEV